MTDSVSVTEDTYTHTHFQFNQIDYNFVFNLNNISKLWQFKCQMFAIFCPKSIIYILILGQNDFLIRTHNFKWNVETITIFDAITISAFKRTSHLIEIN